jgi:hypothetical protein
MIFDKWQRSRITNRMVSRFTYSSWVSPDRVSSLADKLSIKHLRRVDAFTKKYPNYCPELPEKIEVIHASQRDDYLDHLELLTRKVREMERRCGKLDNDSDIPFYVDEIIGQVLTFLQQRSIPELTDQQKGALVAVYFLLTKHWTPDSYPDEFPKRLHPGSRLTSGRWLTEYTLAHPENPDAVYRAYLERSDRRKFLARIFSTAGNTIAPDALPEIMCDYTGDIIQKMHEIALGDYNGFIVLRNLANDGITEIQMKETIVLPQKAGSIPFTRTARAAAALRNYEAFKSHPDLTHAGPEMMQKCMAMIKVGSTAAEYASAFMSPEDTIADVRLVNLLLEHPERADDLAGLIKERGTADFDFLTDITSNVLGEGAL